jgi:hypothetical protein
MSLPVMLQKEVRHIALQAKPVRVLTQRDSRIDLGASAARMVFHPENDARAFVIHQDMRAALHTRRNAISE